MDFLESKVTKLKPELNTTVSRGKKNKPKLKPIAKHELPNHPTLVLSVPIQYK